MREISRAQALRDKRQNIVNVIEYALLTTATMMLPTGIVAHFHEQDTTTYKIIGFSAVVALAAVTHLDERQMLMNRSPQDDRKSQTIHRPAHDHPYDEGNSYRLEPV